MNKSIQNSPILNKTKPLILLHDEEETVNLDSIENSIKTTQKILDDIEGVHAEPTRPVIVKEQKEIIVNISSKMTKTKSTSKKPPIDTSKNQTTLTSMLSKFQCNKTTFKMAAINN